MDLPEIRECHPRLASAKDVSRVHFCVPDVEGRVTEAPAWYRRDAPW